MTNFEKLKQMIIDNEKETTFRQLELVVNAIGLRAILREHRDSNSLMIDATCEIIHLLNQEYEGGLQ